MMIDASTPPVSVKPGRLNGQGQVCASPFAAKLADAGPADSANARAHEVAGPGTTGSRAPDESPAADPSVKAVRGLGHSAAEQPSTEPVASAQPDDIGNGPVSTEQLPAEPASIAADTPAARETDPTSVPPPALSERPIDPAPPAQTETGGTTHIPTPMHGAAVDNAPISNPLAATDAATDTDAPLPTDDVIAATDATLRPAAAAALESGLRRAEQIAALQDAVRPAAELGGAERASAAAPGLAVSHAATALAPAALTAAAAVPLDSGRLLMSEAAPQLAERIRSMVDEQVSEIKLRLDPPKLGSVDVQLAIRDNQVAVSLASSDPQARLLLAQALPDLAASLANRGLQLMGADVGHPSQEHDRQPAERLVRQIAEDADVELPSTGGRAIPRGLLDHYA